MKIFLRACEAVYSQNGPKRPWGQTKAEIVRTCFKSLFYSASLLENFAPKDIIVISDRLSDETLDLISSYGCVIEFTAPSNSESCLTQHKLAYEYACKANSKNIYLVEDDYLHVLHAIPAMNEFLEFSEFVNDKAVINPMSMGQKEHEDKFCQVINNYKETFSLTHTTSMTYACSSKIFKEMYPKMMEGNFIRDTNDYGWSIHSYKQFVGDNKPYNLYKPSISLANHLHDYGLIEDRNWKEIYFNNK